MASWFVAFTLRVLKERTWNNTDAFYPHPHPLHPPPFCSVWSACAVLLLHFATIFFPQTQRCRRVPRVQHPERRAREGQRGTRADGRGRHLINTTSHIYRSWYYYYSKADHAGCALRIAPQAWLLRLKCLFVRSKPFLWSYLVFFLGYFFCLIVCLPACLVLCFSYYACYHVRVVFSVSPFVLSGAFF